MTKGEKLTQLILFTWAVFVLLFIAYFVFGNNEKVTTTESETVESPADSKEKDKGDKKEADEVAVEDLTDYTSRYKEGGIENEPKLYTTEELGETFQIQYSSIIPYYVPTKEPFNYNDLIVKVKLKEELKGKEGYTTRGIGLYVYEVTVKNKGYKTIPLDGYSFIHKEDLTGFRNAPDYNKKYKLNYRIKGGKTITFDVVFQKLSEKDTWKNISIGDEQKGLIMQWDDRGTYTGEGKLDYIMVDRYKTGQVEVDKIAYEEKEGIANPVLESFTIPVDVVPVESVKMVVEDRLVKKEDKKES